MATRVYEKDFVSSIEGAVIEISPLKIKHLRDFMDAFDLVRFAQDDDQAILLLVNCATIAMRQYYPAIVTPEDVQENFDLKTVYQIIDYAAGIKVNSEKEDVKGQASDSESGMTWEKLDLAKIESEIFLLGAWKNYDELEESMSMAEMLATIGSKRELDYNEKKFLAGIQGVDIDQGSDKTNAWEEMKARVFSGGQAANANDIVSYQGASAQRAGFGIGMGLDYERID